MMTREAKTGLLLGLVIIVAIAIILRGVNDSGVDPILDEALAVPAEPPQPPNEPAFIADVIPPEPAYAERFTVEEPATGPAATSIPSYDTRDLRAAVRTSPPARSEPTSPPYRYQQPLPGNRLSTSNPEDFEPVSEVPALPTETQEALDRALGSVGHSASGRSGGVLVPRGPSETAKPKTRDYVVEDGDDLSRIAVKFYGKEEGNRLVNVKRIFQANKRVLPNMDTVRAGQKLKIPLLPGSKHTIVNVSLTNHRTRSETPTSQPSRTKLYVVGDGDSLWSIASEKLGNGARFQELVKLNKAVLKDEDNLSPGMKLRLPGN
jgi:nucleoid-associated protein YgaU